MKEGDVIMKAGTSGKPAIPVVLGVDKLVEEVLKSHMRWHLKVVDAIDDVIVIDSWSATKEDCKRVLELEYGDEIPDHIEVSIEKQPLYTKQTIRDAIEAGEKRGYDKGYRARNSKQYDQFEEGRKFGYKEGFRDGKKR